MITDTITQKIGEAMKAKDEVRVRTLRMLSSQLNYEKIAEQHDLTAEEELVVVRREVKRRQEAIEALRQAQGKLTNSSVGVEERIRNEEEEMKILQEYLPEEMPNSELNKIIGEAITETGATSITDMGKVMGTIIPKVAGKADNSKIAALVKQKLGQ